jgi:glyoxalase/bleomycin resistance protein/dioxygenase superfamily protein
MTIQRMDNILIVVDDLDAVISFFVELGMELENKGPIEGRWVERVIGIDDVRQDIAMLKTPDGHGRIELAMFHTPKAISAEPKDAPANTLGIRRIMSPSTTSRTSLPACAPTAPNSSASWRSTRTSIGSATSAAPRASSSDWPNSSAAGRRKGPCSREDPYRTRT